MRYKQSSVIMRYKQHCDEHNQLTPNGHDADWTELQSRYNELQSSNHTFNQIKNSNLNYLINLSSPTNVQRLFQQNNTLMGPQKLISSIQRLSHQPTSFREIVQRWDCHIELVVSMNCKYHNNNTDQSNMSISHVTSAPDSARFLIK